ncbi:MAG: hypothetical protein NTY30_03315 [Candidatus Berkelbacteria bacterium]|nr:hypothetical protein [Candidatus Berkelbacteria bacterium]
MGEKEKIGSDSPTFEVRSCYSDNNDTIEIKIPETWNDEQRVELATKIHRELGGSTSGMRNNFDYLIKEGQHLRPGCWTIFIQNGKIMVMNCNAPTVEKYNQEMLTAVENSINSQDKSDE